MSPQATISLSCSTAPSEHPQSSTSPHYWQNFSLSPGGMDTASSVSALVGIILFGLSVAKHLYELIDAIRDAPAAVRAIARDAHAFYAIVFSLQTALDDDEVHYALERNDRLRRQLQTLYDPIRNCSVAFRDTLLKLQPCLARLEHAQRFMRARKRFRWYFVKNTVKEMAARLESTKATLNSALAVTTLNLDLYRRGARPAVINASLSQLSIRSTSTDVGFALRRFVGSRTPQSLLSDSDMDVESLARYGSTDQATPSNRSRRASFSNLSNVIGPADQTLEALPWNHGLDIKDVSHVIHEPRYLHSSSAADGRPLHHILQALSDQEEGFREAQRGIEQAKRLERLTKLAYVFIPLSFVSSLFGKNLSQFNQITGMEMALFGGVGGTAVIATGITLAFDKSFWRRRKIKGNPARKNVIRTQLRRKKGRLFREKIDEA